jgi:hypothetical protein
MPSIMPSVTTKTTVKGIKLKAIQKTAPKRLFLALVRAESLGLIILEQIKKTEANFIG